MVSLLICSNQIKSNLRTSKHVYVVQLIKLNQFNKILFALKFNAEANKQHLLLLKHTP